MDYPIAVNAIDAPPRVKASNYPEPSRPSSIATPCNMLMGLSAPLVSASDLARIGVARISLGSALARTADAAMLHAASQIRQQGHFTYGRG